MKRLHSSETQTERVRHTKWINKSECSFKHSCIAWTRLRLNRYIDRRLHDKYSSHLDRVKINKNNIKIYSEQILLRKIKTNKQTNKKIDLVCKKIMGNNSDCLRNKYMMRNILNKLYIQFRIHPLKCATIFRGNRNVVNLLFLR